MKKAASLLLPTVPTETRSAACAAAMPAIMEKATQSRAILVMPPSPGGSRTLTESGKPEKAGSVGKGERSHALLLAGAQRAGRAGQECATWTIRRGGITSRR